VSPAILALLAPAFLLAIVLHRLLCRPTLVRNKVAAFVVAGGIAGALLTGLLVAAYGLGLETIAVILSYAFICELYIFLFTMTMTSVSVSLLLRLRGGRLSQAQVDSAYSAEGMVSTRLGRLVDSGMLVKTVSGYSVSQGGRRLIAVFRLLRAAFALDSTDPSPLR